MKKSIQLPDYPWAHRNVKNIFYRHDFDKIFIILNNKDYPDTLTIHMNTIRSYHKDGYGFKHADYHITVEDMDHIISSCKVIDMGVLLGDDLENI